MKTFYAICLRDIVITDGELSLNLTRGKEYTIRKEIDGTITVFDSCWASGISADFFGGLIPGPGDPHE